MTPQALAKDLIGRLPADGRFLLGLAGPPAAGKSTLAAELASLIPNAQAVPLDGFHLDDAILTAQGTRDRKGAPHTFDLGGFLTLLRRLRQDPHLYAPSFDRGLELSRAGAIEISPHTTCILIEGNWLLHPNDGWDQVRHHFDELWYLDLPERVLIDRLQDRWARHGKSSAEAQAWIAQNDQPNIKLAGLGRDRADRILELG